MGGAFRKMTDILCAHLTPLEQKVYQSPKTSQGTARVLAMLADERALAADLIDALRQQVNRAIGAQEIVALAIRNVTMQQGGKP